MSVKPSAHQIRVMTALRAGGTLAMHSRGERGPYYTLNGRRLSVTLVKNLEAARWITREGGASRAVAAYLLTPEGESVLVGWEALCSQLVEGESEE